MEKFSDFGIKPELKSFSGDKIKISKVLNKEIVIHDFKIEDSKLSELKGNGKCLHLSLEYSGNKHVLFTGSTVLQDMILKVDRTKLPFTTTIIEQDERYEFT